MVLEIIVITGLAAGMLGWNVHVLIKNGICCPTQSPNQGKKDPQRLGRSSRRNKRVAMDPVQEQLEEEVRGPSSGADVPAETVAAAAVNGDGAGAA
eukprot:g9492.t1